MYFHVYRDNANPSLWRWTLYSANHEKIANSGESYWNKADCKHAIDLVASSNGAPIHFDK